MIITEIEKSIGIKVTIFILVIFIIFVVSLVRGLRVVLSRAKVIVELVVKLD